MSRYLILLSLTAGLLCTMPAWTQNAPPPNQANVVETPLPAPVEVPPPPSVPAEVEKPLTATEAAQIALHYQASITVQSAAVQAAHGNVLEQRSGLLPNVLLNTGYANNLATSFLVSPTSAYSPGYTSGITLSQLLFDFNHTRDLVRQAVAQQQAAYANLTVAQYNLVLSVKQTFYQYVQNVQLVAVNEENVRDQQQHLAEATARELAGNGLPSDTVRAATAVADAIFTLNQAQNIAAISRVNLALLMGIDPRTPILAAASDEPAIDVDDFTALVQKALQIRPEILEAQANIRGDVFGVRAAKTSDYPALYGSLGYHLAGANLPLQTAETGYGLTVTWAIFNGGLTTGRVETAQANLIAAQATLTTTCQSVISDVTQAYVNLQTANQHVITSQAEVANAQEAYQLAVGRYDAGLGLFLDVLDAQSALITARTNLVNAQSSVNQARATLAHAIGLTIPSK